VHLSGLFSLAALASGLAISADGPTFDVASVKLWAPNAPPQGTITGGPGTNDPGRFHAPRIDLFSLLPKAFGVSADQIVGPAWLRDVRSNSYAIDATMAPNTSIEQFQQMLQNLLVERFHLVPRPLEATPFRGAGCHPAWRLLTATRADWQSARSLASCPTKEPNHAAMELVFHREKRNFPGYALVLDKGGRMFKEVPPTPDANPDAASGLLSARQGSDGFPDVPGPLTMTIMSGGGSQRTKYQERTMADFISNLGFLIGSSQGKSVRDGFLQPRVVDKTGLTGKYTFILEYYDAGHTPAGVPLFSPGALSAAASDPDGGGPSIFAAIQKQLGLRLDKTADIPLDVIVVDSVDKLPTAN
jgi:uncharacterized protein (TIGR03435 family)